jgi:Zn-dependent protease
MTSMLDILFQNPIMFIMLLGALIISITIHEFAHAYVTDKMGDPTARYYNRVTLDPRAHLDMYGLLFLVIAGFGWGKPVPFDSINLKNPRRDAALIALAGPMSNFTLALILSVVIKYVHLGILLDTFLHLTAVYNVVLGSFNLLPLHPLDGFKVLYGILPIDLSWQWQQTEKYGIFILLFLMLTGTLNSIISPIISFVSKLFGL